MADDFSGIEHLLGLKPGSTAKIDPTDTEKVKKVLTNAVTKKTNQLAKDLKTADTLTATMTNGDLVKCGMSIESLEADKLTIRNEAFEVYRIGKTLLNKYMEDVDEQIDTNDRMYTAGFGGVTAASNALDKLLNMIMRFKQEEEIKGIPLAAENNNTKEMSTSDWIDFIDEVKHDNVTTAQANAIEAEIVASGPVKNPDSPDDHNYNGYDSDEVYDPNDDESDEAYDPDEDL